MRLIKEILLDLANTSDKEEKFALRWELEYATRANEKPPAIYGWWRRPLRLEEGYAKDCQYEKN